MTGTLAQSRSRSPAPPPEFMRWTALSFILLATLLTWLSATGTPSLPVQIRSEIAGDLVTQLPIGRQALVSSLWLMPLPSLTALPFLPFVSWSGYWMAYLYGVALVMALTLLPLAGLFQRVGLHQRTALLTALLLQAEGICLLGPTAQIELLPCLALLATALYFEGQASPVRRALSGVFWGLAFLTHPLGIAAAVVRLVAMLVAWNRFRRAPEQNAVNFIRASSILYLAGIFLFLNWMIMGDPVYPARHFQWKAPQYPTPRCLRQLDQALTGPYAEFVPVASGHWGYVVRARLSVRQGYHFIDFHPDKLPAEEDRAVLLIVPQPGNPLEAFAEAGAPPGALLLSETREWRFLLVSRHSR